MEREGRRSTTGTHKDQDGTEREVVASFDGDGHFARSVDPRGLEAVSVSIGRTVELRQFEFARFDIGFELYAESGNAVERAYVAARAASMAYADYEAQKLRGGDPPEVELSKDVVDVLDACVARSISMSFGLTLQGARKYESHRADVGRTMRVDDDSSMVNAVRELQDDLADRIRREHRRIRVSA